MCWAVAASCVHVAGEAPDTAAVESTAPADRDAGTRSAGVAAREAPGTSCELLQSFDEHPRSREILVEARQSEPKCRGVVPERREAKGCWCAWSAKCVCKVAIAPVDGGCDVVLTTEQESDEVPVEQPEGNAAVGTPIVEPPFGLRTYHLKQGETRQVCSMTVACP